MTAGSLLWLLLHLSISAVWEMIASYSLCIVNDVFQDPYFMKNHLGSYECKLCLTLHNNEV